MKFTGDSWFLFSTSDKGVEIFLWFLLKLKLKKTNIKVNVSLIQLKTKFPHFGGLKNKKRIRISDFHFDAKKNLIFGIEI